MANEWNLVYIERLETKEDLIGVFNPLDKTYIASSMYKALTQDSAIIKYPGHKTVVFIDEAFRAPSNVSGLLLQLVGNGDRGTMTTPVGTLERKGMDLVIIMADNTAGDGGNTNYITAKPVDQALKSRVTYHELKPSKETAKLLCKGDPELLLFVGWARKAVDVGKVDRLDFDNRCITQLRSLYPDMSLKDKLRSAYFKGTPLASMATMLVNITSTKKKENPYFNAALELYLDGCKEAGVAPNSALTV